VSCHVRLAADDDLLRLDMPAACLGLKARLWDNTGAWLADMAAVQPALAQVRAAYGGQTVYNAPLYAVDKRVRLSLRTVERVYLPLLARYAGHRLRVDRGRRRFIA